MSTPSTTETKMQLPTPEKAVKALAANGSSLIILGLVLMLTGEVAIAFPLAGVLAIDTVVAVVFAIAGIAFLAHAFRTRSWRGFAWDVVLGLVYLAAGIFLYVKPVEGVVALTAVIAISLIVDGIVRSAVSMAMRRGPWGWVLASGILSIMLGFAVFALPAGNAVLLLGAVVGINMLASGMAFVMVAVASRDGLQDGKAT